MFKVLGYITLAVVGYIVICVAFDPYGTGDEYSKRMKQAGVICKDELGIAVYNSNGIMNPAYSRCLKQTQELIKQGIL